MSGPSVNPFTSQTIVNYNASPPPDDGSETPANQTFWATIKTKITDPIKVLAEAINSACTAFGGKSFNCDDAVQNVVAGSLALASDELTIATGSITVDRSHHTVDTEGDAATDNLANILTTSVADETVLILRAANTARTVVLKHEATGAGQMHLEQDADYSLDTAEKFITLMLIGTDWYEVNRSAGFSVAPEYLLYQHQETTSTLGTTYAKNAWRTILLDVEVFDDGGHGSLASNQITLAAGTYEFFASAGVQRSTDNPAGARLRLQNITDGATLQQGINHVVNPNAPAQVISRFTIAASKVLEMQIYPANDMGAQNAVNTGEVEVYAHILLKKVA